MVIFYKLNFFFTIFAYILSLLKIKIIYFNCSTLENKLFKKLVLEKKINHFSNISLDIKMSSHNFYIDETYKIIEKSSNSVDLNFGKNLSNIMGANKREIKSIIFNKLNVDYNLFELIHLIKYLKKKKKFFIFFGFFNLNELIILNANNYKYYNLFLQILGTIYKILFNLIRLSPLINKEVFKENKQINKYKKKELRRSFEVIFYPHKTTIYGSGIYSKEFFYLKKNNSIFNRHNILHVEFQKEVEFENFYTQKKLNYYFHTRNTLKNIFPLKFSRNLIHSPLQWIFVSILLASFRRLNNEFNKDIFSKTKFCLVANDYNYDNLTSFILKKKNIKILGVQNRFIYCNWKLYSNIFDTLYVMDKFSEKNFRKNKYNIIKNYKVIGNIFLNEKLTNNKIFKKKPILCFDYSVKNLNEQMYDVSFKNQLSFYEDILNLSIKYPNEQFIIKSKFKDFRNFPEFKKFKKQLKKYKNISFYSFFNNYSLESILKNSKIIITKPSSVIDLALYFKKKVIVHDYEPNFKSLIKNFINYGNKNIFANSFDELQFKFCKAVKNEINLSSSKLKDHYFYKTKQKYDIKYELLKFEKSSN